MTCARPPDRVAPPAVRLPAGRYVAVVLDLDGVLTDTAALHLAAWTRLFDGYLPHRGGVAGEDHRRFTEADYRRYVDGKPRYDGVRDLLAARGISLPYGDPADPADRETVCGLGNRKDEDVRARLAAGGLRAFPDALVFLRDARAAGLRLGVVSASRNAATVLAAVRLRDRFDVLVDGVVAQELGLPGKPDPATFLEAARRLGATPADTVVVEDAVAGVVAGRRGGFGLVVGVARTGSPEGLRGAGADAVVGDLGRLVPEPPLARTSR